jgi:hypothetical protein
MWQPGCGRSNIWISEVRKPGRGLVLERLLRVQQLAGDHHPFERLVSYLREGKFDAAAIDAPFSVPQRFIKTDYPAFLQRIGSMPKPADRPFPRAHEFVEIVSGIYPPLGPPQPLRFTEIYWKEEGLSVRSTLWAGPRGGAAMTAACLKLLHTANRPIWPWVRESTGLLVEAFPMAQLKYWGLPYNKYGKPCKEGKVLRKLIVDKLREQIDLGGFDAVLHSNADALDSVLCAFSGVAARTSNIAIPPGQSARLEGWISVHS